MQRIVNRIQAIEHLVPGTKLSVIGRDDDHCRIMPEEPGIVIHEAFEPGRESAETNSCPCVNAEIHGYLRNKDEKFFPE